MFVEVTKRSGEGLEAVRSELLYACVFHGTLLRVATGCGDDIDGDGVISHQAFLQGNRSFYLILFALSKLTAGE